MELNAILDDVGTQLTVTLTGQRTESNWVHVYVCLVYINFGMYGVEFYQECM